MLTAAEVLTEEGKYANFLKTYMDSLSKKLEEFDPSNNLLKFQLRIEGVGRQIFIETLNKCGWSASYDNDSNSFLIRLPADTLAEYRKRMVDHFSNVAASPTISLEKDERKISLED